MKKIKKFKIKSFINKTGKLTPFSFKKNFPIKVKRIFFLQGKKNMIRGDHAHKKCSQLFILLSGKVILEIKTDKMLKKILLKDSSKISVLIPPKYWCRIKFINSNSILMIACDKHYDAKDYIKNFNKYKKYLRKK